MPVAEPANTDTSVADKEWKRLADEVGKPECRNNYLNLAHMTGADGVANLREGLKSKDKKISEYLGSGSFASVFKVEGENGTVTRGDTLLTHDTLELPIAAQPISEYHYDKEGLLGGIRFREVLELKEMNASLQDVMRVASYLRAKGALAEWGPLAEGGEGLDVSRNKWVDAKAEALRGLATSDGKPVTYADGTPIAIISDINGTVSLNSRPEDIAMMDGMGNAQKYLSDEMEKTVKKFTREIFSKVPGQESNAEGQRSAVLTRGWQELLETLTDGKGEGITLTLPGKLPEGWQKTLGESLKQEGGASEALQKQLGRLFESAPVSADATLAVEVPLKRIDAMIPVMRQQDIEAVDKQLQLIEEVKRSRGEEVKQPQGKEMPPGGWMKNVGRPEERDSAAVGAHR